MEGNAGRAISCHSQSERHVTQGSEQTGELPVQDKVLGTYKEIKHGVCCIQGTLPLPLCKELTPDRCAFIRTVTKSLSMNLFSSALTPSTGAVREL